jgi:hypothetical protein
MIVSIMTHANRTAATVKGVALLMLLTPVCYNGMESEQASAGVSAADLDRRARAIAFGVVIGSFTPSLEAKEQADFLLTPAILVQEAISEDVVPTYPTE